MYARWLQLCDRFLPPSGSDAGHRGCLAVAAALALGLAAAAGATLPVWAAALAIVLAAALVWLLGGRQAAPEGHHELLYRRLFEQSRDVVALSTQEGRLVDINRAGVELYGYGSREEMLGIDVGDLYVQPAERRALLERLQAEGYVQAYEAQHKTRTGEVRIVRGTTSTVRDADDEVVYLLAILRDVTEHKRAEERLIHMARFDSLTGLANRYAFGDDLQRAVARTTRFGRRMALLLVDLGDLKSVNDTFGHTVGDDLVAAVAGRLTKSVRKVDTLARLDGDTFAIVKTDFDEPDHAAQLASRLLSDLEPPFQLAGQEVRTTAYIGIAVFPPGDEDPGELLRRADHALSRAKAAGPNTYRFDEA